MKPQLLCAGVSLWSLLVFSVLKSSNAVCAERECYSNETESLTATTTEIIFVSRPNCTLSIGDNITGNGLLTGLNPGTVHQILLSCLQCCKEITMKPGQIDLLNVTSTTSSISLNWAPPPGQVFMYRLEWHSGGTPVARNTNDTFAVLSDLNSGIEYTITVTALAADTETQGDPRTVTQFTRPAMIRNPRVTNVTVSSLSLNWSEPVGNWSFYSVHWTDGHKNVSDTHVTINNLTAGVEYTISVTAVAGDGHTGGQSVSFSQYTKPERVHSVNVTDITTSSMLVMWTEPQGSRSFYRLLWTDGTRSHSVDVNETMNNVTGLTAGVEHGFTVTAVAGDNQTESEMTHVFHYTNPNPVSSVEALPESTTSVKVKWSYPLGAQHYYRYQINTYSTTGTLLNSTNVQDNSTDVLHLQPGVKYNISVKTIAAPGSESTEKWTYSYTMPGAVTDLTVSDVNTTAIQLTWIRPSDYKTSYSYLLVAFQSATEIQRNQTERETFTFIHLTPGELYTFHVFTDVEGVKSTGLNVSRYTIPNPPGPIAVESQTVRSINFTWPIPDDMNHGLYNFSVSTIQGSSLIKNSWFLLDNLESGSAYNITVVTVGAWNDKSTAMMAQNYTRPFSVTNLRQTDITTDAVTLLWEQSHSKPHYSYVVQSSNGSSHSEVVVSVNTSTITGLLSGSNYSFTVTTQTADGTQAAPVTVSFFTRPYGVEQLRVERLNTTTIHVIWRQPEQYKSEYQYRVQTTGCGSQNKTVREEAAQISELTPGTNCTLCVFVIAVNGIEGDANCVSQHTHPESVQTSISSQGSNSSVLVSWSRPAGKVDYFQVYLNSTLPNLMEQLLNSTSTSFVFEGLSAGTLYTARVITHSGPLNVSSGFITNATFPNPPGSIEVLTKTTGTIEIRWEEAPLMTGASFSYKLTHTPSQGSGSVTTTNTTHTFNSLMSGTSYNISIVTVGVMDFESEEVHIYMVTTRPYSVEQLRVERLNTTTIHVIWRQPEQYKSEYQYRVQTTGCGSQNKTVREEAAQISELTPGTNCTLCVFVIAVNGIEGDANCISQHTYPESVQTSISSQGSNSSVLVSWSRPAGKVDFFQVYLNSTLPNLMEQLLNSTSTSFVFEGLSAGTLYTARVITHSGPLNVSSGFITNATFPNPPGSIEVLTKTTGTIEIRWEDAPLMTGASFSYKLTHTPSQGSGSVTTTNTTHTLNSLMSGTSYNISIVTVGVMDFESEEVHIYMVTTRPYSVEQLRVERLNTTTIHVIWRQPEQYKSEYQYRVQTTGCGSQNKTVREEAAQISELTPGTNCTLCVFVIAVNGIEGDANCVSQHTHPESVQTSISSQGSNSSVLVSWSRPAGKVDFFQVYLNSTLPNLMEQLLNSTSTSFVFEGLSAGTLYTARVITHSGPLNVSSGFITNATFPNPPGSIEVLTKTTGTIEIRWEDAPLMTGASFSYKLTHTPSQGSGSVTTTNTTHTLNSLMSGTSYNISIVTVGVMDFESEEVHIYMVTTRPYSVEQLRVERINTTTIHVIWRQPEQYKSEYQYRVQTTGCGSQNKTVREEAAQISELTPGTNCTLCVFVIAVNGIEGDANCVSQHTHPESVQTSISSQGSNSSVLVSWSRPAGKVDYFQVYLNSTLPNLMEQLLNSTSASFVFEGLSAGTLYTARVITHSGPFNASSGFITNATFPNPPGLIEVLTKTASTIEIRWEEAPLMTGVSFFYKLTHTPSQGSGSVTTTNTTHTFHSLISGVCYNISIITVGVMDFQSKEAHLYMVNTSRLDVGSVVARMAQEDKITVKWEKPGDYQGGYHYILTWHNQAGLRNIRNITMQTEYTIDDLDPGSRYYYSVTPDIVMGSHGVTTRNSSCTNAAQVKNLTCESPNKPKAEIILSWTQPRGRNSGFQVTVNNSKTTISSLNTTVSNLRHHTKYKLTVVTLSCGQPSTPVSHDCWTGITDPPIPPDYETLLDVVKTEHNRFSIEINRELLDNNNGPVTHVGVLMTKKPADNTSDLRTYLGNTYDQWKAEKTPVYLATVTEINPQLRSIEDQLSIEVGDGIEWEGYTNGPLDSSGRYLYAIVLFTSLNLQNHLVNYQESLVSITNFYPAVILPSNPATVISIVVGATMGVFSVLFIILVGFIIYWKRMYKKETTEIEFQSMRSKASISVRIEDYEAYFRKQKADSNCGFAEEFEDLKLVGTGQSRTSALTLENKAKNRYNNVLPYDCSRVKLSIIHGSPFDDYINANYMPGFNSRKEFIASQGPLPATVGDFWRMIWEKNVQTLVMLTRCNEQGRVKCEQYWGPGTKHFENITVTTTSEIPLEDWTIREFEVKNVKTMETRSVRQFHFTAWPDHGVPETTELLIGFRHLVREHMDQYSKHSPTVVHCSAGVGRTGTFIAIDTLIFQIERENAVDIFGTVHELRMHRTLMVQTEDQYVFLNQCAMDIIKSRTGTNVDLIYQNAAAFSIYENIDPKKGHNKNGYNNN
uniref:receptor-type tyrosine-protein phosphatase eta-like isoform X6 n=1 Tax=Solea senegalensis TaxID=28829 RepID=UPI001CD887C8|nr:receptor-type tyrosine-protein phosphatase eta-like isoform X6 [Solea senegalensis]